MDTVKAISHIPGWALGADGSTRVTSASQAYERVPAVRRSVNLIADSVVSVPHRLTGRNDNEVEWPFSVPFSQFVRSTVSAYLIEGAAYWLKLTNSSRFVRDVQWLNPKTVQIDYEGLREDGSIGLRFTQSTDKDGKATAVGQWDETRMLYIRQWSLESDVHPGKSATHACLDSANLLYHITRFGRTYFESGAMPMLLMSVEGSPAKEELERAQTFFKRAMTGVSNAFRVLTVRGAWEPKIITPPLNTLAMPDLADYALDRIAEAFGIPVTMLKTTTASGIGGGGVVEGADLQFWRNTIRPLLEMLQGEINRQLLTPMGLTLAWQPEMLDVFQADETMRAGALQAITSAGVPLTLGMQILGYELPDDLSYEELETMLQVEAAVPVMLPAGPPEPATVAGRSVATDALPAELRRWRNKAEKRAKLGKSAAVPFESDVIPDVLSEAIEGALEGADKDGVSAVFADALTWEAYP